VSHKRKCFNIYKDLLCSRSPYFAASHKNCWNGSSNEVYLDADATAFGQFTNWIFRDTIPAVDLSSCEGLAEVAAFYKLADFLLVNELCNSIMDAIIKYLKDNNWDLNFFSLSFLSEQNLRTTPFYKLVLRNSVRRFIKGPELFEEGATDDMQFLMDKPDLLLEILQGVRDFNKKPYDQVWKCNRCTYHEHTESTICVA